MIADRTTIESIPSVTSSFKDGVLVVVIVVNSLKYTFIKTFETLLSEVAFYYPYTGNKLIILILKVKQGFQYIDWNIFSSTKI